LRSISAPWAAANRVPTRVCSLGRERKGLPLLYADMDLVRSVGGALYEPLDSIRLARASQAKSGVEIVSDCISRPIGRQIATKRTVKGKSWRHSFPSLSGTSDGALRFIRPITTDGIVMVRTTINRSPTCQRSARVAVAPPRMQCSRQRLMNQTHRFDRA
jgi:hypothetical protein